MVNTNESSNYSFDIIKINSIIHDGLIYHSQIEYNQKSLYLKIPIYVRIFEQKKLIYKNIFKKVYSVPIFVYDLIFYNFKNISIKDFAKIDSYLVNQLKNKEGEFIFYADPDFKISIYGQNTYLKFLSDDNIKGYTKLIRINFLPIEKLGLEIFEIEKGIK